MFICTNTRAIFFQEPEPEKKVIEKPKLKPRPPARPPSPPKEDVKEKMFQLKGTKCSLSCLVSLLQTSVEMLSRNVSRLGVLVCSWPCCGNCRDVFTVPLGSWVMF